MRSGALGQLKCVSVPIKEKVDTQLSQRVLAGKQYSDTAGNALDGTLPRAILEARTSVVDNVFPVL